MKSRSSQGNQSAFSLVEIAVAMAILSLIGGTVLSIVWQAGDMAAELRALDRSDAATDRFFALLRESIENLPPDATITITPAEETSSGYPEIVFGNTPTAFIFGEWVGSSEECVLTLRPDETTDASGAPTFQIALSRTDFAPDEGENGGLVLRAGAGDMLTADEDGRYWLPLLKGLAGATWRYWDDESGVWLDEWTEDDRLPALMSLSLGSPEQPMPLASVFTVPVRLSDPEAAASAETAATAATTTTTVQPSGGGSGSRGDGGGGRGDGGGGRPPGGGGGPPGGGPSGSGAPSGGTGAGGSSGGGGAP